MWKIGPECAAQQRKKVAASNDELWRAQGLAPPTCPLVGAGPQTAAAGPVATQQKRGRDQQHPGQDADVSMAVRQS